MIGKDFAGALERITTEAARRGLAAQVHYEGEFSAVRDPDGHVPASGWQRLLSVLERARLAADPWPVGGGSSRFEAYLAGTPSAHMGIRLDRAAWGRGQAAVCDILFLNVPRATAFDEGEYRAIARRCLYDAAFADAVADEQREVAVRLSDEGAWWTQLRTLYDRWARMGAGFLQYAFVDPMLPEQIHPPTTTLAELSARVNEYYLDVARFPTAFTDIELGPPERRGDVFLLRYRLGAEYTAHAYMAESWRPHAECAALIIPGSGHDESSAVFRRDPERLPLRRRGHDPRALRRVRVRQAQ